MGLIRGCFSFRRRLPSWCVLLLLGAGGGAAKREAWMSVSSKNLLWLYMFTCFYMVQLPCAHSHNRIIKSVGSYGSCDFLYCCFFLVTFRLYDKDCNGLLDSSVSFSHIHKAGFSWTSWKPPGQVIGISKMWSLSANWNIGVYPGSCRSCCYNLLVHIWWYLTLCICVFAEAE